MYILGGTPGTRNCYGDSVLALLQQHHNLDDAARASTWTMREHWWPPSCITAGRWCASRARLTDTLSFVWRRGSGEVVRAAHCRSTCLP